ncbi:MAG TPA: DNA internalization-related competence protein ComEC/Rec2 [candidate division Zixibacteria bacterium]|nr:DNA internalization-related competence protein ComEC/Rec2 [candidate division Zixibacteria bacterium]
MTIIFLGIAWLLGLWIAAFASAQPWVWAAIGSASLILAIVLRKKKPFGLILGLVGFFCLGAGRSEIANPQIDAGHIAHYNGLNNVVVTGLVDDEPKFHDRVITLRLKSGSIQLSGGEPIPVEGYVQVTADRFPAIAYGTRLRMSGQIITPEEDLDFDYRAYLARRGIYSQMSWPDIQMLEVEQGNPVYHAIYGFKERAQSTIHRILPDPQAALLSGILLGNDDEIPAELEEQFRISGLSHIIAISGFNIAILAGVLLAISRPFLGPRWSAWFVLAGLAFYTVLVGADAAVVRAAIMGALFVIAARLMGRPTFAPAGLFTAAIVMTAINPNILWDIGFQLSFAATLGLMLYVGPASEWSLNRLQPKIGSENARKLSRMLAEILFATLAATLITLPIILYHFGQLSLISPLANLLVLPAQPGVMIWGGLATLSGMIFPAVGTIVAWLVWPFLTYTISSARFFASIPAASVPASLSMAGLVAIYALIFGVTWLGWKGREGRVGLFERVHSSSIRRIALTLSAIVAIVAAAWALSQPDGKLHVSFLDVGQGDATLIQTPGGRHIIIDGGAYPSMLNDHIGREIPFWDRDLDLIIATHPDEDHVAGLPGVLERYDVGLLLTNGPAAQEQSFQVLLDIATENAVPIYHAQAGDIIEIGDGVRLEFLYPPSSQPPIPSPQHDNDQSIALRLVYGEFSLLLTGDAGFEAEQNMLTSGYPLSAVVYKAGHHGAKSSSWRPFLTAVGPQYVIVSAGEGNRYGHPHPELLERASGIGATVLRTDKLGTIEVVTDGERMWWESQQ